MKVGQPPAKDSGASGGIIREDDRFPFAVSALISLLSTGFILFLAVSNNWFVLENFKYRTIGIAVLVGVDASMRTTLYVVLVLFTIAVFCASFAGLSWLLNRYPSLRQKVRVSAPVSWGILGLGAIAVLAILTLSRTGQSMVTFMTTGLADSLSRSSSGFFISQACLALLVVAITLAAWWVARKFNKIAVPIDFEEKLAFYIVIVLIGLIVLGSASLQPLFSGEISALSLLLIIVDIIALSKVVSASKHYENILASLSSPEIIVFNLIMPVPCYFLYLMLSGNAFAFNIQALIFYACATALFFAAYYLIVFGLGLVRDRKSDFDHALMIAGVPAILIPVSIPLANELQYTLSDTLFVPARTLSIAVACALLAISVIIFIFVYHKAYKLSLPRLLTYVYFPVIALTFAVFRFYRPAINFYKFDMFHHGELLISNQQLFSFGKLPFITNMPTHGLSDISYQLFYSLVNGYSPVQPIMWNWIPCVVAIALLYFFLIKLVDPYFSLIAIVFFPVYSLIGSVYAYDFTYYSFCLIPLFSLLWALKKPTLRRLSVHWLVIVLLVAWRTDFGIAAAAVTVFILGLLACHQFLKDRSQAGKLVKSAAASFLGVFTISAALPISLVALNRCSLSDLLYLNFIFIRFQDAAMSYVNLTPYNSGSIQLIAFVQYLLLPLICIVYVILLVYIIAVKKQEPTPAQWMITTLAVVSLILLSRSLGRHSLMDVFNVYFVVLLALCAPFFASLKSKYLSTAVFIIGGTIFLLLLPMFNTVILGQPGSYVVMFSGDERKAFFEYRDWHAKESRVLVDKGQYEVIVQFLKSSLSENETFYDFTNSPMLYVLADKNDLSYFIPNLYQTSDPVQQDMIRRLADNQASVPVVVFKQKIHDWDNVDGVPNEVRSYRVAEYIYQHYEPLGYVDHYQIWALKNSSQTIDVASPANRQQLNITSPRLYDATLSGNNTLAVACGNEDPQIFSFLDLANITYAAGTKDLYLVLSYRSSSPGTLQYFYNFEGDSSFTDSRSGVLQLTLRPDGCSNALLEIPYDGRKLTDLRLDPPRNSTFEIDSVSLIDTNGRDLPIDWQLGQDFNLRMLPYVWGTYDSESASVNTPVQETISNRTILANGGEFLTFNFNPAIDKTTGNYLHLRIKSQNYSNVYITYGNNVSSSVTFAVVPSSDYEDYLVRISSQWAWMSEPVSSITIRSSDPVWIESISIRKGD